MPDETFDWDQAEREAREAFERGMGTGIQDGVNCSPMALRGWDAAIAWVRNTALLRILDEPKASARLRYAQDWLEVRSHGCAEIGGNEECLLCTRGVRALEALGAAYGIDLDRGSYGPLLHDRGITTPERLLERIRHSRRR